MIRVFSPGVEPKDFDSNDIDRIAVITMTITNCLEKANSGIDQEQMLGRVREQLKKLDSMVEDAHDSIASDHNMKEHLKKDLEDKVAAEKKKAVARGKKMSNLMLREERRLK